MSRPRAAFCARVAITMTLAVVASFAHATEVTVLDRYLDDLRSWRTAFTQSLTDARGRARGTTQGTLVLQRPGKFRWESAPEGVSGSAQVMVADGRNLWFLDRDLDQVTVKPAGNALTATPAALLAGTAPLRDNFEVQAEARRDGLEWVAVRPKAVDAEFRRARFGFAGPELKKLELEDKLGQRALLVFARSERNGNVSRDEFVFVPPPGVDVIGKSVP